MRVADFPDLLPLRDEGGARVGLFSGAGSWLALCWGDGAALEVHDTRDGAAIGALDFADAPSRRVVWSDRLELDFVGERVEILFAAPQTIWVRGEREPRTALPRRRVAGGWLIGERLHPEPRPGLAEDLRDERERAFARAAATAPAPLGARDRLLLARAVTTLAWNWRAPVGDLAAGGCIPSPFGYRGFWGWDSWKHAHALARVAPETAVDQLHAQLARARDGMVPDTVFPDPAADNWRNTKPPLAAWALDAVRAALGGAEGAAVARELFPACAAFLKWWDAARRRPGEILHRPGGVDWETATWDLGWDRSARFTDCGLRQHGEWLLLDAVPPDLAAFVLAECEALARLAGASGRDPAPWRARADAQRAALSGLWDPRAGAFVDRRDDGRPGALAIACALPPWAGAADSAQTAATRALLCDPARFATPLPFPALAAGEPGFDPDDYWNGGVWLDHAAWALAALGDDPRAAPLRERLLARLADLGVLWECLHPFSGEPVAGARPALPQFSWSAAAVIEILTGGLRP